MSCLGQEGKKRFLTDLAENVLRGRLKTFQTSYPHGSVPPGYDRLYFDESGELQHRVHSYERFRKPPGWILQIEPSEGTELVEAVVWAFETMDSPSGNVYRVTCEFNRRGVPSKNGGDWSDTSIRKMLKNRAYIGVRAFGKDRRGKYRYVDGKGKIVKSGKGIDKSPPLEIEDAHPALIDRDLFERVQEKLDTKRKPRNRNSDHILTGLLRCAHCGKAIVGNSRWLKSGNRRHDYICSGPVIGVCKSRRVGAEEFEGYVVKHIQAGIDQAAETLAGYVREALARRSKPAASTKSLRKRLGSVEAKITRATRNMLLLDDRAAQEATKMLAEMQAESESIRDEIARADGGAGVPRKPAEIVTRTIRHRRDVRPGGPSGDENGNP